MDNKKFAVFVIIEKRNPQGLELEYGVIYTCPNCNEHVLEKFNFCPECGKIIRWIRKNE